MISPFLMGLAAIAIPLTFFLMVQFPNDRVQFTLVGIVGILALVLGWIMTEREKKESNDKFDEVMGNMREMISEMRKNNENMKQLIIERDGKDVKSEE